MKQIVLQQPKRLHFGDSCSEKALAEYQEAGLKRIFVVTGKSGLAISKDLVTAWKSGGIEVELFSGVSGEPDIVTYEQAVLAARAFKPDAVVGFGGGSPLDVAKLVAALWNSDQLVQETFGIGKLRSRSTYLSCIPTTAGTGSEVSPNAILLDESEQLKKGVVSPYLVADSAFIDPVLTYDLPPSVTAATGYDALVHCMEAYANRNAHPIVDVYALEGIRRIGRSLERAVRNGSDARARCDVMLGALYGGFCLAPVNTAAVHALAYPLGGSYHISHGVSNSLLTPHVFRFNLPAAPERYAAIALSLGVPDTGHCERDAESGLAYLTKLSMACGIPQRMRDLGVPQSATKVMAKAAMTVTRLLNNNLREMTEEDAERIYEEAW